MKRRMNATSAISYFLVRICFALFLVPWNGGVETLLRYFYSFSSSALSRISRTSQWAVVTVVVVSRRR